MKSTFFRFVAAHGGIPRSRNRPPLNLSSRYRPDQGRLLEMKAAIGGPQDRMERAKFSDGHSLHRRPDQGRM